MDAQLAFFQIFFEVCHVLLVVDSFSYIMFRFIW